MLGAMAGATGAYLTYKKHFDEDPGDRLGIFATGPAIKSYGWNLLTEIIGTFVLIGWIIASGKTPSELGPLACCPGRCIHQYEPRWRNRFR